MQKSETRKKYDELQKDILDILDRTGENYALAITKELLLMPKYMNNNKCFFYINVQNCLKKMRTCSPKILEYRRESQSKKTSAFAKVFYKKAKVLSKSI